MKIESVYIKNFRCFKEDTIYFDDYTCLVGANGAGKSTVFSALHVFFRHYKDSKTDLSKLIDKDFHHSNTKEPIVIRVTFKDLSDQAKIDLKDYVRQDKLIVTAEATYDELTQKAEIKQYGSRLGIKDFKIFFEKEKAAAKATELNECYAQIKDKYPDLPAANSKDAKMAALRDYEAVRPDECELLPSEDQFYGATKGSNKLAPHIQWVFVPAAKDVTEEGEESKNSALGQLLLRTVRAKVNFTERIAALREDANKAYAKLLGEEQKVLDELSGSLKTRLSQWAHPSINASVKWKQDPDKSIKVEEPVAAIQIGERGFEGELSRFGHGLQRSYMLALLQELNTIDDAAAPTLILCIEEPELYQHPPQARYLAETLQELANDNTQVMVCSHSPIFIPKSNFDKVRIVRESGNPVETKNSRITYKQLSEYLTSIGSKPVNKAGVVAKLFRYLSPSINEMFFCKVPVFVEGIEDIAYIKTYTELEGKSSEYRKLGCHLINADKKSNIIEPLAVARLLNLDSFLVFDLDTDAVKQEHQDEHKRDNKKLLTIQGHEAEAEWPGNTIKKDNLWGWKTNLGNEVKAEIANWQKYFDKACLEYGNAGGLQKNPLVIARTLELAWLEDEKSQTLITLVESIIKFTKNKQK
ncbi:MAG: AAA family ATPase [Sediminibacterium sp.]|jgi:putative ATP-dependent endonuclease of OLD family|nr:AAA family ATPase [Chitinophagaceae bacterium]